MANEETRTIQGAEAQAAPAQPYLVEVGRAPPAPIALPPGPTVVGRTKPADLVFDATGVSRMHARLVVGAGRDVQLVDLGSKNGTWLNGERVTACYVQHGDLIGCGTVSLELVFLRDPAAAAPSVPAGQPRPHLQLSEREWEVADLVAQGATNAKIARALFISPSTVSTHLERIYARLEIHSRAELTALVMTHRTPAG